MTAVANVCNFIIVSCCNWFAYLNMLRCVYKSHSVEYIFHSVDRFLHRIICKTVGNAFLLIDIILFGDN